MTTKRRVPWSGYGLAPGESGSGYGKKGAAAPPAGASLWTLVGADGGVGTAPASDLNDWTCYISAGMGNQDYNGIGYGKDGNGDGLWVAVNSNNNKDIRYSSDPSAGIGAWGNINPNATMLGVAWGDDVWIAVGGAGKMWRSTAGTSGWSEVNISGLAGLTSASIYEVVSDGAGNWMFAQGMNVYESTDGGVNWARVIDFTTVLDPTLNPPANLSGYTSFTMAYTADRWSVFMRKSSNSRIFSVNASPVS